MDVLRAYLWWNKLAITEVKYILHPPIIDYVMFIVRFVKSMDV